MRTDHPLADREHLEVDNLVGERLILRPYCQKWTACAAMLEANGVDIASNHEVASDRDASRLLEAGLGIAVVPASTRVSEKLRKIPIAPSFEKSIHLYAVAGRSRSQALIGLINLLRSADWSRFQTTVAVS